MRIKRFMCIMDSMTDKELDSSDPKLFGVDPPSSRVIRVAKGSGSRIQHVIELLGEKQASLQDCHHSQYSMAWLLGTTGWHAARDRFADQQWLWLQKSTNGYAPSSWAPRGGQA